MKQLYFLSIIFLSSLSFPSLAQDPVHFILGEKEFTNTNIYTLLYDDKTDILYAGTNNGVYAYKQNNFIELTESKEQIGNSFFGLKHDKNGDVFCSNLNGQIFKIVNNKLVLFYQATSNTIGISFSFFFVEENDLVTFSPNLIKRIDSSGKSKIILSKDKEGLFSDIMNDPFHDPHQVQNGDIYFPISNKHSLCYSNGKLSKVTYSKSDNLNLSYLSIKNTFFILNENGDLKYSNRPLTVNFNSTQNRGFNNINEEEIISIGTKSGFQIIGFQNDTLIEKQSFFKKEFISLVSANQSGTLFLGSFGEGIKVIPNKQIIQPKYDHLFSGIAVSPNNEVYLSTRGGEIFQNKNGLTFLDKREFNIDCIFYLQGNFSFNDIPHKNLLYDSPKHLLASIKDFYQLDSNNFIVVILGHAILITKDGTTDVSNLHYSHKPSVPPNHYYLFPSQRYASVTWAPLDSTFYFANNYGVYARKWSSPNQDSILWKGQSFRSNDLEFYKGQLICGTDSEGILLFQNKKFVSQISQKHGLKSNIVKKILAKDHLLYILTKAGMQVYDLNKKEFLGLGVAEGLVNDEVTNFAISNDKLWLMEKHSFYAINIAEFANPQKENLIAILNIDSILINGQSIDYSSNNTFTYKENEVNIFFDYRDIESKTETSIQYTLDGKYDDWKTISSSENNIEFQSLPIGNYSFKIKAIYRNQSTDTFIYSFQIFPPIWQRWWFYLLIVTLGVLISTIIFKSILNRQRKELAIKNELNNSKLIAIRSQMNPHFIFNALNSIQHLVLKGDIDNSYSFINKFASLVRKTLDYSGEEFITLEDEIKLIEVYLSLEKLRFKDNFEFEIIKPDNLKISIPPMLIQPFIENAILHGLLHKKGQKKLTINFHLKEKLTCSIEDNGVGRAKAKAIKQRQTGTYKSFSLNAIKRRFEILNNYYDVDLGYEYQDFESSDKNDITTKVLLKIPIRNPRKK